MPETDQRPCDNGCIRKGTEELDQPELMTATKGDLCEYDWKPMLAALKLAPKVVEHVVSLMHSKAQAGEKVDGGGDQAPMPWNTQAFNDANDIYQRLVYWCILWAERIGVHPPSPASHAWRANSGFVVGLPADITPSNARYIVGVMSTWLQIQLESICYQKPLDDVLYFRDELREVFQVNARWPQKSKPRYSKLPCPICRGKIAVYPPEEFGDDTLYKCEQCGRVLNDDEHETYAGLFESIEKTRKHLGKKYADAHECAAKQGAANT